MIIIYFIAKCFETLLANNNEVYFTSIPKTLRCIYDSSWFYVLHYKQVFGLPSKIDRVVAKQFLESGIRRWIYKYIKCLGFFLQCLQSSSSILFLIIEKTFFLSFHFSSNWTFIQTQLMTNSPKTSINDQLALYFSTRCNAVLDADFTHTFEPAISSHTITKMKSVPMLILHMQVSQKNIQYKHYFWYRGSRFYCSF